MSGPDPPKKKEGSEGASTKGRDKLGTNRTRQIQSRARKEGRGKERAFCCWLNDPHSPHFRKVKLLIINRCESLSSLFSRKKRKRKSRRGTRDHNPPRGKGGGKKGPPPAWPMSRAV